MIVLEEGKLYLDPADKLNTILYCYSVVETGFYLEIIKCDKKEFIGTRGFVAFYDTVGLVPLTPLLEALF
jgi:hypothetical protein